MEEPQIIPPVNFLEAVEKGFKNLTDFSSRSRRSEYWYLALAVFLVEIVLGIILILTSFFLDLDDEITEFIFGIICFCGFLFMIPCSVRRLHDIGKSGWFILLSFVLIIGEIILLVFFCTDSQIESNEYGSSPKYSNFPSAGDTMV